jgi:tRNA threonylcarbamoyladenosine biosynthesis protein TsaB
MTVVIGFDTATDDTAVAALRDGSVVSEAAIPAAVGMRPAHASMLLPQLEQTADAAGGWAAVGRIAVGVGPGSFTGLRIGIATGRALAQALGLPLAGVGTLAALAAGVRERNGGRAALAVLDARRGEVFAALYDERGEIVWEPFVASPGELAGRLAAAPDAPLAAGSGTVRFRTELQQSGVEIPEDADGVHRVEARQICALGAEAPASDPREVAPIYLRQPDAERWHARDSTDRR